MGWGGVNLNAELIVSRLEGVRARSNDQWSARCPAHEDRGPSLSVKALSDGRVLLHCFAGCAVESVLDRLSLDMEALFPQRQQPGHGHTRARRVGLLSKGQALDMLAAEALFVSVVAASVARGETLTEPDRTRLMRSAGRMIYLQAESAA